MSRKKIVFQTNAPWLKSGLAENGRVLMNWLARHGKYDLVYYCSQVGENDPNLSRLPYKAHGAVPSDPNWPALCRGDFGCVRDVHYGGRRILDVIKAEKPDIWVGSDDAWAFPGHYYQSEWFKQIHSILHITVDSIPVTPQAYEQAAATKHFFTWAKFAVDEMKKREPQKCAHVDFMYGASDTRKFRPVSPAERAELRRYAGIDPRDTIFLQLSRNQLRKEMGNTINAFAEFKQLHPEARAKLLLHTDWGDEGKQQGWDLPRLRDYFGLKAEDVLCTYFCRTCRRWEVRGYAGEKQDCKHCGAKQSQFTINGFHEGVEDDELYQIYGLADASLSVFTSGGYEYQTVNSLLSGLPVACTNYSCGVDFCEQPFVYPIKWHSRHEVQSSFIKAANDIHSIREFMEKVYSTSLEERREWGAQGRDWAERNCSVDAVGGKWEKLFDSLPPKDWSSISLTGPRKNDAFPMPKIEDLKEWVTALYKGILLLDPDPKGMEDWLTTLRSGVPREAVYNWFINKAREDNARAEPPKDFGILFDGKTEDPNRRKRCLFVIKESGGDAFICTALFPGLKKVYPDHDLYVACEPKFAEIFAGNSHIHKVIPYHPAMEQELAMAAYVDAYIFPAVQTQRQLGYLYRQCGLDLSTLKLPLPATLP